MQFALRSISFFWTRVRPWQSIPAASATAARSSWAQQRCPSRFPRSLLGQTRGISAYDKSAPKLTPQLVMAVEHYNRLVRMIEAGEKVKMSVELAVEFRMRI